MKKFSAKYNQIFTTKRLLEYYRNLFILRLSLFFVRFTYLHLFTDVTYE